MFTPLLSRRKINKNQIYKFRSSFRNNTNTHGYTCTGKRCRLAWLWTVIFTFAYEREEKKIGNKIPFDWLNIDEHNLCGTSASVYRIMLVFMKCYVCVCVCLKSHVMYEKNVKSLFWLTDILPHLSDYSLPQVSACVPSAVSYDIFTLFFYAYLA